MDQPGWPGIEVASAGVNPDCDNQVTPELLEWADLIFVMERSHKTKLASRFSSSLKGKRIICLDIRDEYPYMDPELIKLLKAKVCHHLPAAT